MHVYPCAREEDRNDGAAGLTHLALLCPACDTRALILQPHAGVDRCCGGATVTVAAAAA